MVLLQGAQTDSPILSGWDGGKAAPRLEFLPELALA